MTKEIKVFPVGKIRSKKIKINDIKHLAEMENGTLIRLKDDKFLEVIDSLSSLTTGILMFS